MNLVVLCGGRGTRVSSISQNLPKILLNIGNKKFIYLLLDSFIIQGISKIFLLTSYKSELIKKEIGDKYKNIEVKYFEDDINMQPGTGSALNSAIDLLPDHFLLQYGDTILDLDYVDFYQKSLENEESLLMAIYKNELKLDENNVSINGSILRYYNSENKLNDVIKTYRSHIDYGLLGIHRSFLINHLNLLKESQSLKNFQEKISLLNLIEPYFCNKRFHEIGTVKSYKSFVQSYINGELNHLINR